ncbi:unnamed protein product, partial [Mesorhabditis belari]|uniref:Eukaryotic translation initiation factor 3 subunit M n=1 Tax=Mesorhabditis belari TaxID=2138241 RepID=A0AAF3F3X6_9BILA
MADTKSLPVFAFIDDLHQLEELRGYLNKLGAKLDPQGPKEPTDNLVEVVNTVAMVASVKSHSEVDLILSSISSLIVCVPGDRAHEVVSKFCAQLTSGKFEGEGWQSNAGAAVRVLSNLFRGFAKIGDIQQVIFESLISICDSSRLISDIDTSVPVIEGYMKAWGTDREGRQRILRALHVALLHDERADQAAKVMLELLGTYTSANAAAAQEDARECVRTAVVDPKSFSFDHLVRLDAVHHLQQSDPLMHEALGLFTSGTLKDYQSFVKKNPKFVQEKLKVAEEILVKKMRLLTLMSIAEKNQVIRLSELAAELSLPDSEELEEFIIEAIQVNAISGKINEVQRTLSVTSFQHRSFGREQWAGLRSRLSALISMVKSSHVNIRNVNQEPHETVA